MLAREEIDAQFEAVDELIARMDQHAPASDPSNIEFRGDLSRLLVIAIVSAYEASVRATLVEYAKRHHNVFGCYVEAECERLNAQIKVKDLKGLAGKFDPMLKQKFENELKRVESRYLKAAHRDIRCIYGELIKLRHRMAHSANAKISIEDAQRRHRIARHVLYAFDRAFA